MASFTFGYGGAYGYRGSLSLAQILYQTQLGDFTYDTDSSGNVVLTNQGNLGTSYDGLPYSGRGIELGATNDVDIPIHHTLGSAETISSFTVNTSGSTGLVVDFNTTVADYHLAVTTVGSVNYRPAIFVNLPSALTVGAVYKVSFTATVNSGTCVLYDVYASGSNIQNATIVDGVNEFEFTYLGTETRVELAFDGTNLFNIDVTSTSLKQITNPNSYLTYYDFTDGLVTLGNSVDGGSSEELVENWDFSSDVNTFWTTFVPTISNGEAVIDYTGTQALGLQKMNALGIGRDYLVTTVISNYVSGDLLPRMDNKVQANISSNGTHTFTVRNVTDGRMQYNIEDTHMSIDSISIKEILPISTTYTLNTKTVNNIITHTTPWSALDWVKINNNPNLVVKLALETLGATKTIPELDMELDQGSSADSYYMCSEKSGAYLVDSRVATTEIQDDPSFDTPANWTVSNATVSGGQATMTVVAGAMSYVYDAGITLESGKYYIVEFDVASFTGTGSFAMGTGAGGNVAGAIGFSSAGISAGIYKAATDITNLGIKRTATSGDYSCVVNSYSVREATATEIANYASTVRTNADLQQKGIQTTAFVTDGAGVPTAYSDNLLQFNGDGRYVDTGWIPSISEDWTIEYLCEYNSSSATDLLSGVQPATSTAWIFLGVANTGKANAYMSTVVTNGTTVYSNGDKIHLTLTYNSTTKKYILYDNNVALTEASVPTITQGTISFPIGVRATSSTARANPINSPIGIFKIHKNKYMTASEVATAYAQAKAIYPTLP